jgi:hypothetical protein
MIFNRQPVLFQGLVLAIINLLVVFGLLHLTDVQLGAVNAALAAILGFFVNQKVEPIVQK